MLLRALPLLFAAAAPSALPGAATHPRLFFTPDTASIYPERAAKLPYLKSLLRQYEAALNHKLNYTSGGVPEDITAPASGSPRRSGTSRTSSPPTTSSTTA